MRNAMFTLDYKVVKTWNGLDVCVFMFPRPFSLRSLTQILSCNNVDHDVKYAPILSHVTKLRVT